MSKKLEKVTYKLIDPIEVASKTVDEIVINCPTARLVRECGWPMDIMSETAVNPNVNVCLKYVAKCSTLTPSEIDKMSPRDIIGVCGTVLGFFGS